MYLWKNQKERKILIIAFSALTLAIIANIKPPLISFLRDSWLGKIFTAEATPSLISNICCSIVAAYLFYLFIEVIPRRKIEITTKKVLNSLLTSIFYSYEKKNIYGHDEPPPV